MPAVSITLDEALDLARTGDVWLFRGRKAADRAIQVATNSPVNHVGMSVVIGDLPPLMWHAELGRSLPDLWSGTRHRGVQLHDLREAVIVWSTRYGQRAWLRQLDRPVTSEMEDAVLRTVARMDGTPFPSTARLVSGWLSGRVPPVRRQAGDADLETAYCAEVLAVTYRAMGLLPGRHGPGWYDAGRFWSGDRLRLSAGFMLGGEIAVHVPPGPPRSSAVGGLAAGEPSGDGPPWATVQAASAVRRRRSVRYVRPERRLGGFSPATAQAAAGGSPPVPAGRPTAGSARRGGAPGRDGRVW